MNTIKEISQYIKDLEAEVQKLKNEIKSKINFKCICDFEFSVREDLLDSALTCPCCQSKDFSLI